MSHYSDLRYNYNNSVYSIKPVKRIYKIELSYYDLQKIDINYYIEKTINKFINSLQLTEQEEIYFDILNIDSIKNYITYEIYKQPHTMITYVIIYFNKDNKNLNFTSNELDEAGGLENFIKKRNLQNKIKKF